MKTITGAQVRDAAGQTDPLAFQKHLMSGDTLDQISGTKISAPSGFSGILNSVTNLLNEAVQSPPTTGETVPELVDGVGVLTEGVLPVDEAASDNVDDVVSDEVQSVLGAVAVDVPLAVQPKQVAGDQVTVSAAVQDFTTGSRRPAYPLDIPQVEVPASGTPVAMKADKIEFAAVQFALPEMKRVVTPNSKSSGEDPAVLVGQSVAVKGGDGLKVSSVQQATGVQSLAADGDRQPSAQLRSETVPSSFSAGVTTVLKEIVTERQVSSSTAVTERTVVEQLSNGMLKVATKQGGKVVIKLTPEHLGNVEVTLAKKNGLTMVRVVVDRSETLEMVRSDIRSLERSLIESGIDVRSNSISLALKSSSGDADAGHQAFDGNSNQPRAGGKNNSEVSDVPRRAIEGRGGILNIRV
ncbi:flagellar hook-length control protein FliK [Mesorhizobium sp. SP-1A]|uniref:flagellar hook-length control protein FliK n=1 Tax=Mesorhizobium sp. SP-1A TaxID=3077840 RepID=UPI0028F6DD2D|nr:flagellar hook-length control protein FliK [Mesorhizobium sp. SP-1A]